MDTASTLPEAPDASTRAGGSSACSAAPHAIPHSAPPLEPTRVQGLGAELRESVVLLGLAVAVTVGLTTAAQAAASMLG